MEIAILVFLSSGLFLGWSLGANDAANVFGTAVGSRMIRFSTAAAVCAVFVILGAVISGAGATHGLGRLGAVNALAGAFMVALSAGLAVYWMTRAGLPVSVTQAIVGGIVGWNLYSGSITDLATLTKIVSTWIVCPILGAVFGAILYRLVVGILRRLKLHLLTLDHWTRIALLLAGALAAYTLGANNIGNVVGVFVEPAPLQPVKVAGMFTLTPTQQLFLVGGLAIGAGVFYSRRVMATVGENIMTVSAVGAWVVVVAHSLVLFLFSSLWLEDLLLRSGLPAIPLIPVSSSQAVVGAVIGVGLVRGRRGARQIRWRVMGSIALGWVYTPVISALLCFFLLFFLQHVFRQEVYRQVYYQVSGPVLAKLEADGLPEAALARLRHMEGRKVAGGVKFRAAVRERIELPTEQEKVVISRAEIERIVIDRGRMLQLERAHPISKEQLAAVKKLAGSSFDHRWQLEDALGASKAWQPRKKWSKEMAYLARRFGVKE